LRCDTFIAGGAKTFNVFADDIEKWIVTEIPITVDADTFMPAGFLDGFERVETNELEDGLKVKTYIRK
jgi:dihydrofolate reductase